MSNKLSVDNYVLDDSYQLEQVEYNEEVDGEVFPDRDEHLKKKDEVRSKYRGLKDSMNKKRVRR